MKETPTGCTYHHHNQPNPHPGRMPLPFLRSSSHPSATTATAANTNSCRILCSSCLAFGHAQVPAHEVRLHCCGLLRQVLGRVCGFRLVLPVVDGNRAGVSRAVCKALVQGVRPAAATAKTWLGGLANGRGVVGEVGVGGDGGDGGGFGGLLTREVKDVVHV
jgi:hypothetical protein